VRAWGWLRPPPTEWLLNRYAAAHLRLGLTAIVWALWTMAFCASPVGAQVELPQPQLTAPIVVRAPLTHQWQQDNVDVWLLRGGCEILQDQTRVTAQVGVLFVERGRYAERRHKLTAYLEGGVVVETSGNAPARLTDSTWYGSFESATAIDFETPQPQPEPHEKPSAYYSAMMRRHAHRTAAVRPTQFTQPAAGAAEESEVDADRTRRLRAWPRSSVPVQGVWEFNPQRQEWVAAIDSGINLLITGVEGLGTIDIATDRIVLWTFGQDEPDLSGQTAQSKNAPLEIYMEGNIVFRQGERVVLADRMYYDVRAERGVVLNAELLTPVKSYDGLVRLRAELVEQLGRDRFQARNGFVTSSRLGRPGYRLAATSVYFEDQQSPAVDPATGGLIEEPVTGELAIQHERLATSFNNLLFIGEIPVLYWPFLATDLERPEFYVRRIRFRNDSIFGTQLLTDLNPYQILGIRNPPEGTDWDVSLDYLSDRGIGHGTKFQYSRGDALFGIPGAYAGFIDYWGIDDQDQDDLGAGRSSLEPEKDYRYRLLGRHRWFLPDDFQLTAELGWISDRNFLEQYFEYEWDTFKDLSSGVELKQLAGNMSWSVTADARINSFFTQTEWLPRFDHFWLGQPLLADRLTWFEHTSVGVARLRVLTAPEDPADLADFAPLPWEVPSDGERVVTRHEIDLPLQAGPFKVVPYALGELAHWGEALDGEDLDRAYGRVGVRSSLPIWAAEPTIESELFNVHGLAHKVSFELDASIADATRDLAELPLYDPLDDDAVEHFRRRFAFNTFGGATPIEFDERFYALRSGLGEWVTSPSAEIADDLTTVRAGVRQRLQTRRGLPGHRRITDWVVLDSHITWFPDDERDNFGEDFGLLDYDFRWHIGDRTTITSRGIYDFFGNGQRLTRVGLHIERPPRGDFHISFRNLEGPIQSQVLRLAYSYRMSPKWVSAFSTAYDFGEERNVGQNLSLTRIGESFLVSFSFNLDEYKDNFGFSFVVEPRFLPQRRLGTVAGAQIAPAGALGLE
jgi:hypothetical protein